MHQFKNERTVLRLNTGQILPRLDNHFRDANLVSVFQRIPQERVGFVSASLRLQIVRLIEENWIYLFQIDEVLNVDSLSGFEINSLKIFLPQHDVFALLVLIALNDLVPRNLPA